MRRVQKTRRIIFDLFQKAKSQGDSVHQNLLSDHSIMAYKIEKVEHSVHHLGHVLDFKFTHLWTQMADVRTQLADVTKKLDTLTSHLLQDAQVGQGAEVTSKLPQMSGLSKLPPVPGVPRPPVALLDAPSGGEKKSKPTESTRKPRGIMAYRAAIIAKRLAEGGDKHSSAHGVSS